MEASTLQQKVNNLPADPGIYQFLNDNGIIIYVGKAKNLNRRVSSYFRKNLDNRKTQLLVAQIREIQHFVVDNEEDALLLENNLIKKYQPKYNILLKDDKTFPWLCIKNEEFPRIIYTRSKISDGSVYFGPYTSIYMAKTILDTLRKIFQLRNCNLNLHPKNIEKGKFKKCLEYHIGNCKAPCENIYPQYLYNLDIEKSKEILKGNLQPALNYLKERMQESAERYDFEKANNFKLKLEYLDHYKSKSIICSTNLTNLDVFSIVDNEKYAFVNYFKIQNGAIISTYSLEVKKRLSESKEEILELCMVDIRDKFESDSTEIILPFGIGLTLKNASITIPKIGEKKKLLELCEKNARFALLERQKNDSLRSPMSTREKLLDKMRVDLKLPTAPRLIECFDNSNLGGDFPVSACVVFKDAKPLKSQYRHYNVKTVVGPNDFATMEEVIERRYVRQVNEQKPLPDLIIIDGGKGQLSAAYSILEKLNLEKRIPVIGIAKRLEEIYYANDAVPLYLDKKSETLRVLQNLRDEAHRFGISFHRNKRSLKFLKSDLVNFKGIGEKTMEKLLIHFKSLKSAAEAPTEEIEKVFGKKKTELIVNSLKALNHS